MSLETGRLNTVRVHETICEAYREKPVTRRPIRNLRRLRAERGWSQERLAAKEALDRTYLSSVERSEQNITLDNIYKVAQTLDASTASFSRDCRTASEVRKEPNLPHSKTNTLETLTPNRSRCELVQISNNLRFYPAPNRNRKFARLCQAKENSAKARTGFRWDVLPRQWRGLFCRCCLLRSADRSGRAYPG